MDETFIQPPEWMTAREYLELCAIFQITTLRKTKTTSQYKGNKPLVARLIRHKFIGWKREKGHDFAVVTLLPDGVKLIDATHP